jgi:hypothetical protein
VRPFGRSILRAGPVLHKSAGPSRPLLTLTRMGPHSRRVIGVPDPAGWARPWAGECCLPGLTQRDSVLRRICGRVEELSLRREKQEEHRDCAELRVIFLFLSTSFPPFCFDISRRRLVQCQSSNSRSTCLLCLAPTRAVHLALPYLRLDSARTQQAQPETTDEQIRPIDNEPTSFV